MLFHLKGDGVEDVSAQHVREAAEHDTEASVAIWEDADVFSVRKPAAS